MSILMSFFAWLLRSQDKCFHSGAAKRVFFMLGGTFACVDCNNVVSVDSSFYLGDLCKIAISRPFFSQDRWHGKGKQRKNAPTILIFDNVSLCFSRIGWFDPWYIVYSLKAMPRMAAYLERYDDGEQINSAVNPRLKSYPRNQSQAHGKG